MFRYRLIFWAILCLSLLAAAPQFHVSANPPQPATPTVPATKVPEGFRLISSATGVELYRKNYSQGSPDFVQIVNLAQGAGISLIQEEPEGQGQGRGMFGGPSPKFQRRTLDHFWNDFRQEQPEPFCITNGQFFILADNPSAIALPLKKDGVILTEGFDYPQYTAKKLMLEIWPDRVQMVPLSKDGFYNSTAPNIIGGLTEEANKRAKHYVGRTFFGIDDRDGNGLSETVLVFNTQSARQVDAAAVLRSFGADRVMMLDGGGSTQLICENDDIIPSDRFIPQAIGIFAGSPSVAPAAAIGGASTVMTETVAMAVPAVVPPTPTPAPQLLENQLLLEPAIQNRILQEVERKARELAGIDVHVVAPSASSQVSSGATQMVTPTDLLIVPAAILPVAMVLFLIIKQRQHL